MITIIRLDEDVAQTMIKVYGERIFKTKEYDGPDGKEESTVTLNENAELKYYNFDKSITIQLGSKKFLIDYEYYWRVELT